MKDSEYIPTENSKKQVREDAQNLVGTERTQIQEVCLWKDRQNGGDFVIRQWNHQWMIMIIVTFR
jgi:hypothetical protein